MMQTNRIRIYPASREQMEQVLRAEEDEDLRKAYREMLEGCLSHPEQREWYAMWMIEKTDGTHLGLLWTRIFAKWQNYPLDRADLIPEQE